MRFNLIKLTARFCLVLWAIAAIIPATAATVGKTLMARGNVTAQQKESHQVRELKRRSPIFDIDEVKTAAASVAQIRMSDGALLALKAGTELKISEYMHSETEMGSVVMELVSGGLRTITGKIKGNSDNYKLTTPIGSIGIRGTHYEVEMINGNLYVAVWDGSIDINTHTNKSISIGEQGSYSFCQITASGEIVPLLRAPSEFKKLPPLPNTKLALVDEEEQSIELVKKPIPTSFTRQVNAYLGINRLDLDISENEWINEEALDLVAIAPIEQIIATRKGVAVYDQLVNSAITSSLGAVSNTSMLLAVDFDNGLVSDGTLSFKDEGGEWFSTFNGIINAEGMELGVNFASHGQSRATGNIDALFIEGGDALFGQFYLFEIQKPDVNASGSFRLK